jgi:serine/threonine-protein kinase
MSSSIDRKTQEELQDLLTSINPSFQLEKFLGKGGQKIVYRIIDNTNGLPRIFKLIKPNDGDYIERVKREVLAANTIDHRNIPSVLHTNAHGVEGLDEPIWIIEECIPGKSLRQVLDEKYSFSIKEIIKFIDTMLSILEKAESVHIVHRDIKPENIMFDDSGEFWLIDFGISRHLDLDSITASEAPFGPCTIGYSAAEQFRNRKRDIDIRADLFSMGVVVAEMITGINPYMKNTKGMLELIKRIENQPLPLLRIEGDKKFLLARYIRTVGDNRLLRRPRSIEEAKNIFPIVKDSL